MLLFSRTFWKAVGLTTIAFSHNVSIINTFRWKGKHKYSLDVNCKLCFKEGKDYCYGWLKYQQNYQQWSGNFKPLFNCWKFYVLILFFYDLFQLALRYEKSFSVAFSTTVNLGIILARSVMTILERYHLAKTIMINNNRLHVCYI